MTGFVTGLVTLQDGSGQHQGFAKGTCHVRVRVRVTSRCWAHIVGIYSMVYILGKSELPSVSTLVSL